MSVDEGQASPQWWKPEETQLVLDILRTANLALWAASGDDDDFAVRLWSPGAERIYGHSREEVLGKSYVDLFVNPRERERAIADHSYLVDSGARYEWNFGADDVVANGTIKTMLASCFRVEDPRTGKWLLAELGIDISSFTQATNELRRIHESELDRQELMVARAMSRVGDAVTEVAMGGTLDNVIVAFTSALAESMLGIERMAVWIDHIGESKEFRLANGSSPLPFSAEEAYASTLPAGSAWYSDDDSEIASGRPTVATIPLRTFRSAEPFGIVVIQIGVDRRFSASERERLETVAAFSGPLYAIAEDLHAQLERERELLTVAKNLVYRSVFHTVGNEVFGLRGVVDALDAQPNLPAEVRSQLQAVRAQTERVDTSIAELRKQMRTDDHRAQLVVADAIGGIVYPLFAERPHIVFDLRVEAKLTINMVQGWLFHILHNLISNAIQVLEATDGGGDIRLSANAINERYVEIHVEDSGPGVDPDIVDTLFDEGVSRRRDGSGEGLWIVRDLVEASYGKVRLADSPSDLGGAHFVVTLPTGPMRG